MRCAAHCSVTHHVPHALSNFTYRYKSFQRVTELGQEASGQHEEDSNIEIDGKIYEIDPQESGGGKKLKSGEAVIIPAGTALGKSGKASTNGAMIKKKEEEEEGGKKNKRQRQRAGLFERYLNTKRTDEQERNVEQLHRHLYSTTFGDNKSVVAVRVVVSDGAYYQSEDHLRNKVFGTNGDEFNLKSAYAQCSANQLIFNPKENTSANDGSASINNGVLTIELPNMETKDGEGDIRDAVTARIKQLFGNNLPSVADYWMYCIPSAAWNGKSEHKLLFSVSCCIIQTLSHRRIISSITFNQRALLMLTLTGTLVFTIMNGGKDNINLVNKFASICVHMET